MAREHARSSIQSSPIDPARLAEANRVTWVSVVVNVILTAMQVVVGTIAHSQSLIADAMHTLTDIVSDGFVLYANRKGAEAADETHPYGHGRYETAASLALGTLLSITGAGILYTAVQRLQVLDTLPPVGVAAMVAASITLIGKESLFRYMLRIAERLRSPMLVANAWHARADALSSLVVAIGIGGALAGYRFADAVGAIIVGAMIVKAGVKFAWDALNELIDTGLSPEEVATIRTTLEKTPGVVDAHEIRTRRMGHKALVDVHIQVSPRISVSEGHLIAETARARVLREHEDVLDVLVHVDAEEDIDFETFRGRRYPDRSALLAHLQSVVGDEVPILDDTVLHYLGQRIEADAYVPLDVLTDQQRLQSAHKRIAEVIAADPWFCAIRLHGRCAP